MAQDGQSDGGDFFGGGVLTELDPTPLRNPDSDADLESDPKGHSNHPKSGVQIRLIAYRFMGLGIELAAYSLVLAGLGYWLDSAREHTKPFATALGALIGFGSGMIRLIQNARRNAER